MKLDFLNRLASHTSVTRPLAPAHASHSAGASTNGPPTSTSACHWGEHQRTIGCRDGGGHTHDRPTRGRMLTFSFARALVVHCVAALAVAAFGIERSYAASDVAVSQVIPATGPLRGATVVHIEGEGFAAGARVWVGGARATHVQVLSSTLLRARTLPRTAGPADVIVAVGANQSTLPNGFAYTAHILQARIVSGPQISVPRVFADSVELLDGRFLIIGGAQAVGGTALDSAEIYDPEVNAIVQSGISLVQPRSSFMSALLADGRVLVCGGVAAGGGTVPAGTPLASAELFDPSTSTFAAIASTLPTPLWGARATTLVDGRVLMTGGLTSGTGFAVASTVLFDPLTGTFGAGASAPYAMLGHSQTLLANGDVLIVGGQRTFGFCPTLPQTNAAIYQTALDQWTAHPTGLDGIGVGRRHSLHGSLLPDGRVALIGGYTGDCAPYPAVDEIVGYDPNSGTFALLASLAGPRVDWAGGLAIDGTVLIAGGHEFISNSIPAAATKTVFRFLPASNSVQDFGELTVGRSLAVALFAQNGSVILAGGVPAIQIGQLTIASSSTERIYGRIGAFATTKN